MATPLLAEDPPSTEQQHQEQQEQQEEANAGTIEVEIEAPAATSSPAAAAAAAAAVAASTKPISSIRKVIVSVPGAPANGTTTGPIRRVVTVSNKSTTSQPKSVRIVSSPTDVLSAPPTASKDPPEGSPQAMRSFRSLPIHLGAGRDAGSSWNSGEVPSVVPLRAVATWPRFETGNQNIFMFTNRSAGGQRGEALMQVPQPFLVDLGQGKVANLMIFDILEGPSGNKPGFVKLKEETNSGVVRIVVAGGDGTILWAIEECEKHHINTREQVMLAVMPLGTGNDFSRFAGWGGAAPNMPKLMRSNYRGLKQLVKDYATAKPQYHDIWKVDMAVNNERGSILKTTGKENRRKQSIEEKKLTKLMHSYFSAGNDARAGMSQEKVRTRSRVGNLLNYGFQICLKGLPFREKEYVRDFVSTLYAGLNDESPVIFREDGETDESAPRLLGNPQVLMMLNIPNCYGGFCRFWEGAGSVGVTAPIDEGLMKKQLSASDGRLEVITYGSIIMDPAIAVTTSRLPAHRFNAKRIYSGGPMLIEYEDNDDYDIDVHVQIDGEFFKLRNPTTTTFELHQKIRVLHSHGNYRSGDTSSDSSGEGASSGGE